MTYLYEGKIKHTKEMLQHFITMTYEVKNANAGRHITVFSLCWFLLAYIAREEIALFITFTILGVVGIAFVLLRKHIGVASLAKKDINYQKQIEVSIGFGQKGMVIENPVTEEVQKLTYSEITSLYRDKLFYFIGINNEEMQIIYRRELSGTEEEFETFIEGKVGRTFYDVNLPFVQETKRSWVRFRYNWQMNTQKAKIEQEEREARIQEKKRNKKKNKKK